jgi:hypothetical protein
MNETAQLSDRVGYPTAGAARFVKTGKTSALKWNSCSHRSLRRTGSDTADSFLAQSRALVFGTQPKRKEGKTVGHF